MEAYIQTNLPHLPQTRQSLRLVTTGAASHFKGRLVQTHTLQTDSQARDVQTAADGSVGVVPRDSYLGRYYNTDLSLGLTETADDVLITSAVCKVTMAKNIVSTAIAGRDGTVKEMISAQDYEIEVTFSLINTEDEYPADAMRQLSELARENSAVYIDSAFLRIFDIDRVVVEKMEIDQATYGNTQEVVMTLKSDDDYEVEVVQTI
ncbi:MAG: hypothetical protein E7069_03535 [Bacteroidales bacterium]|nr:hypothetical protein [Bacteroidales bacterium]